MEKSPGPGDDWGPSVMPASTSACSNPDLIHAYPLLQVPAVEAHYLGVAAMPRAGADMAGRLL
jgi:hypothetical protein